MTTPAEALRLDIEIARLASEYAALKDPQRRVHVLSSMKNLAEKRDSMARPVWDVGPVAGSGTIGPPAK